VEDNTNNQIKGTIKIGKMNKNTCRPKQKAGKNQYVAAETHGDRSEPKCAIILT